MDYQVESQLIICKNDPREQTGLNPKLYLENFGIGP